MDKFKDAMRKGKEFTTDLPGDLSRLKESVSYAMNPNHRHDEEHEQEADRLREEIRDKHRFRSFAPERTGNDVKWFQDGSSYFWALSELLDKATNTIFILDWWLTPELYLRRPCAEYEDYRLDKVLLRAAERGVKVLIIVYKEVTQTTTTSSAHAKHFLEGLHENISVMRHPDHLGGEIVLFWSHHEKVVLVDNVVACVGGLDLCFGRWDTHSFPLSDAHPFKINDVLYPGQDYNNARVQDFVQVDQWVSNQQSRLETARMPWHDIHFQLVGPAVLDVAQHFVERWNYVRNKKYKHKGSRYPLLRFPHDDGELGETDPIIDHPHMELFKKGISFKHFLKSPEEGGFDPYGGLGEKGNMRVQVCRSSADWSSGILNEHSIQDAYIQLINEANHYVYIENQFFVSKATDDDSGPVKNKIACAIAQRIISAAQKGEKFKVFILIPHVPGFPGDLKESAGVLAIMAATYNSINRGPKSICEVVRKAGFDPYDYLGVYHLRSYDRLPNDPKILEQMNKKSGLTYDEVEAALARVYMGDDPEKSEARKNSKLHIRAATKGESLEPHETKNGDFVTIAIPETVEEARSIIKRWEDAAPEQVPAQSVAHYAMRTDKSLLDEPWYGDEESEKAAYVTEELYIHCKLLIVDDRRVIMGSANANDRSQNGDHDSEIAIVVEDNDMIETTMNGSKYMASRFAATLRRNLWKHHLGMAEPEFVPPKPGQEYPNDYMRCIGTPLPEVKDKETDQFVADPLDDKLLTTWKQTAHKNTEIFDDIFHTTPSDRVRNWDEYSKFVPKDPIRVGHVASDHDIQFIKQRLSEVRGHLIEMPYRFLEDVDLNTMSAEVNPATIEVYL